jgi:hypothetical protein
MNIAATALNLSAQGPFRQFCPVKWADAVIRCELSSGAKLLAFVLLSNFNHATGLAKRRMDTLADQLGKSARTVQRYRSELEKRGLLLRWQTSRHKCNRFQALMPIEVDRPRDPSVGSKQIPLELEPRPMLLSAGTTETQPGTTDGPIEVATHPAPDDANKKVSTVGGHSKDRPPVTVIGTKKGQVRQELAPSGFAQRPRATTEPSPQGEVARSTLRRSGVSGTVVTYLAFVCAPHELDWLAQELVVAGDNVRNPTRWIRKVYNDLAAGVAKMSGKRPQPSGPKSLTEEDVAAAREAEAERRRSEPLPPVELPELHYCAERWDEAFAELDDETQVSAKSYWSSSPRAKACRRAAPHVRERQRRKAIQAWLAARGVDLGLVPTAEAIDDKFLRELHVRQLRDRAEHMAEHPELYS